MKKTKAFSLIEAVIAMLIMAVVMIGSIAFYFVSNKSEKTSLLRRRVLEVVSTKLEDLRHTPYSSIPVGGPIPFSIGDYNGNLTVISVTEDGNSYKKILVDMDWYEPQKQSLETINFVTYIAPPGE